MAGKKQDPIEQADPQYLPDDADMPEFGGPEPVGEEDTESQDEKDAESGRKAAILAALGAMLEAKFKDSEKKRLYIEKRWLEDLRQYHGRYDPDIESALNEAESCALFLNITKPKTHAFSARVMDMVLPTDEKNWGLEHTPVPETAHLSGDYETQATAPPAQGSPAGAPGAPISTPEGAPVMESDITQAVDAECASRCEKMEEEIDDQLTEGKYNAVQRKAIEQMSRLGTGIIMGPVIVDEWKVTWVPQERPADPSDPTGKPGTDYVRKLVPNKDKRPGLQWVDCWNFYPDMSANSPDEWGFAFVQHLVNGPTVKKFAKRFNFDEDAVKDVLAGERFNVNTLFWLNELRAMSETQNIVDERFRLLRYYGEITFDDMDAAGMDPTAMGYTDVDVVTGTVWLCNGKVLKIDLNPLDSGDMPFSVCYCDKDEASPFGTGIPRLMRGEQESVNAAWRMKHDNAALSVCPQTIFRYNSVTPADGDYHMKPKKVWYAADEVVRVQDVFATFSIDSHQEELDNILQLGIRFADDVTQLPLLMQGDQAPHITQTAQGMSLLYNASTVVLRRTIKFYDDYVTEPLITRFFEWNMQFNPREEIKGDFRCVARGSSTLLDKEQQGTALDTAMQMAMQPTWQPYIDMKKLIQQGMKIKRIQDIILPDDKIAENLKQQQEAAQAAAQAQAPAAAAPAADPLAQAKIDVQKDTNTVKREEIASKERLAAAELAAKKDISLAEATALIAKTKISEDAANQRFNAEAAIKRTDGTGF